MRGAEGAGGGRKVPLIGTWHAFVLECIFCSYLDAGPAGKTELCQEGERDREADRERHIEGETDTESCCSSHSFCMSVAC